jgi:predicted secreted protein
VEVFFSIGKVLGKESVFSPVHHLGTADEFVANLAPLIRNFTNDKRFALYFYSQHIVVIVLVYDMFGEHRGLLILAAVAFFLIIEEMNREINVMKEN